MPCEERGRTWSDAVAAGEVTLMGDACNGEVTDVSQVDSARAGSQVPRKHVRMLPRFTSV